MVSFARLIEMSGRVWKWEIQIMVFTSSYELFAVFLQCFLAIFANINDVKVFWGCECYCNLSCHYEARKPSAARWSVLSPESFSCWRIVSPSIGWMPHLRSWCRFMCHICQQGAASSCKLSWTPNFPVHPRLRSIQYSWWAYAQRLFLCANKALTLPVYFLGYVAA